MHNGERDPWLESRLGAGYLEDDGFTEGVMQALPPRRTHSRAHPWLIAGAALLGALLVLVVFPIGEPVVRAVGQLMGYTSAAGAFPVVSLALVLVVLAIGLATAVAGD